MIKISGDYVLYLLHHLCYHNALHIPLHGSAIIINPELLSAIEGRPKDNSAVAGQLLWLLMLRQIRPLKLSVSQASHTLGEKSPMCQQKCFMSKHYHSQFINMPSEWDLSKRSNAKLLLKGTCGSRLLLVALQHIYQFFSALFQRPINALGREFLWNIF